MAGCHGEQLVPLFLLKAVQTGRKGTIFSSILKNTADLRLFSPNSGNKCSLSPANVPVASLSGTIPSARPYIAESELPLRRVNRPMCSNHAYVSDTQYPQTALIFNYANFNHVNPACPGSPDFQVSERNCAGDIPGHARSVHAFYRCFRTPSGRLQEWKQDV